MAQVVGGVNPQELQNVAEKLSQGKKLDVNEKIFLADLKSGPVLELTPPLR